MRFDSRYWALVFSLAAFLSAIPETIQGEAPREIRFKSRDLDKIKTEIHRKKEEKERLKREAENLSENMKEQTVKIRDIEAALLHTRKKNMELGMQVASTKSEHDQLLSSAEMRTARVGRSPSMPRLWSRRSV